MDVKHVDGGRLGGHRVERRGKVDAEHPALARCQPDVVSPLDDLRLRRIEICGGPKAVCGQGGNVFKLGAKGKLLSA